MCRFTRVNLVGEANLFPDSLASQAFFSDGIVFAL